MIMAQDGWTHLLLAHAERMKHAGRNGWYKHLNPNSNRIRGMTITKPWLLGAGGVSKCSCYGHLYTPSLSHHAFTNHSYTLQQYLNQIDRFDVWMVQKSTHQPKCAAKGRWACLNG